jgi:hypothetical protein
MLTTDVGSVESQVTKAVFTVKPESNSTTCPKSDFQRTYLNQVKAAVHDWIIDYEPSGTARVLKVEPCCATFLRVDKTPPDLDHIPTTCLPGRLIIPAPIHAPVGMPFMRPANADRRRVERVRRQFLCVDTA